MKSYSSRPQKQHQDFEKRHRSPWKPLNGFWYNVWGWIIDIVCDGYDIPLILRKRSISQLTEWRNTQLLSIFVISVKILKMDDISHYLAGMYFSVASHFHHNRAWTIL